ncbi:MAG: hypothetical protein BGO67_03595 [Alphaproteobacteria bacterium 41-28]|nr:MAG: hypothetical protein BGO67_03595 [Alphaproteobacteria bacterium 41-28]
MTTQLAKQILMRMRAKNLSIPVLEKAAQLKNHTVRNILRGRSLKPNAETINAIARALGCTVEDLLEKKEIPQTKALIEPKKENIDTPYEYPNLLRETVDFVITFLQHNKHNLSLEQVLNCVKLIYEGSLENDPVRINEEDAAFWMILATDTRLPYMYAD